MTDEITPESTDVSATADPQGQANPDPSQKARELEQRLRGLDAKVTAQERALKDANARVAAFEAGQIDADATLKAQLQAKDQMIADLQSKAAAVPKMAQFPNAARILGESIASVPDERLADMEAQLSQAPVADAPLQAKPNPVPSNPPNSDGDDFSGLTRDQLLAQIARTPGPFNN